MIPTRVVGLLGGNMAPEDFGDGSTVASEMTVESKWARDPSSSVTSLTQST